jgi:hypothetical protein
MPLLFSSLHRIGHEAERPEDVSSHTKQPTASQYINELIDLVVNSVNKRGYDFIHEEVEVCKALSEYHSGADEASYLQAAGIIASRLHVTEIESRAQNVNLIHPIPKGVLIQAFVKDGVSKRLLIVKSDYDDFLDNKFITRTGLPKKKKLYKAFLAELNDAGAIVDMYVSDSTGGYSKYWWRDFLELKEKRGDAYNTKALWESLERDILNPIRKDYRNDYEIIRNAMLLYVRSKPRFELNDFIQTTLESYDPQDPELQIAPLVTKLRALPVKRANSQFDTSFDIIKSEIKARIKNIYHVNENIDLVIKAGIEGFKDAVHAIEENGIKYLKIRTTEEGFKVFERTSPTETS